MKVVSSLFRESSIASMAKHLVFLFSLSTIELMNRIVWVLPIFLLGCQNPMGMAVDAVQKTRDGNAMGREALRISKQMSKKIIWQERIAKLSEEMLRISDKQIARRDNAKMGAKFGVEKLEQVAAISSRSFRRSLEMARIGKRQALLADAQIEDLQKLYALGREGLKQTYKARDLLKEQIDRAEKGL